MIKNYLQKYYKKEEKTKGGKGKGKRDNPLIFRFFCGLKGAAGWCFWGGVGAFFCGIFSFFLGVFGAFFSFF